ncbi:AbiV family abortive infection protein [Halomonas sp. 707B3]|uniref:AbiV family abortive infection protein n=1 Tax=Halomonas sp. 707B3 TaxID=1681043 RepID=UPI00209F0953|nr:AbiV family abortive infection protein [Halomonas sp. 707B3]MCP1319351.1 AbiV family abortive infection protein [Halomonas sp. 707B3]
MTHGLKQYKGRLSASQVASGINAAQKNARRLYEDAQLLFDNDRYPTGLALAILSIEESGKASILRSLSLAKDGKELKDGWKKFRSHKDKNAHWIAVDLMLEGARSLKGLSKVADPNSNHPELLDQLKQVALYTDCLGSAHWSFPEDVVSKELAAGIIRIADIFSRKKKCTEDHVSLWIKHMLPVKSESQSVQYNALLNWFKEMHNKGYIDEGGVGFEEFLNFNL